MIRDIPDRDKVLKFWNGSRAIIQKGLWRDNLNPEISTWDQVVAQAEIIEIVENLADRRDRKGGLPQSGGSTEGSTRSKVQSSKRSAQAVTFDTQRQPYEQDRHRSRSNFSHHSRNGQQPSTPTRNSSYQTPSRRSNSHQNSPWKNQSREKSQSSSASKPEVPKLM